MVRSIKYTTRMISLQAHPGSGQFQSAPTGWAATVLTDREGR